jgi:hypothetical protein
MDNRCEKPEIAERRFRVIYIRPQRAVEILNVAAAKEDTTVYLPVFPELPEGFTVVNLGYDLRTYGIVVMVAHPSFDPVPDGKMAPEVDREYVVRMVKRAVEPVEPESESYMKRSKLL